jgi:hypothetical protein
VIKAVATIPATALTMITGILIIINVILIMIGAITGGLRRDLGSRIAPAALTARAYRRDAEPVPVIITKNSGTRLPTTLTS